MKHNIEELERHLKGLQKNLDEGYMGGCMLFIYDALTELNVIKRKANVNPTSEKQLATPAVVGQSEQLLAYTEWLKKEGLLNATVSRLIVKKYVSK